MIEYTLIVQHDPGALAHQLEQLCDTGWEPLGGIAVSSQCGSDTHDAATDQWSTPIRYLQAMVRERDETPRLLRYRLLTAADAPTMAARVNEALHQGWGTAGHLLWTGTAFVQPMMREEREEENPYGRA